MFKNISIFISWTLAIVFFSGCSFFKKKPTSLPKEQTAFYHDTSIKEVADCKSAREYIATSEYLKSQSKYFESSLELQKVSTKVAVGCTGAAQRFIKTYKSLMKVEAGTRLAVKEGIMLANSTDDVTKTYLNVFMTSYLKNYLDMDVTTSVKLARALSVNYNGDPKIANKDFKKFVEFCIKSKNLDLPRPQCASFSRRWASYGAGYKKGVFKPFKKMFNFLKSSLQV